MHRSIYKGNLNIRKREIERVNRIHVNKILNVKCSIDHKNKRKKKRYGKSKK